MKRYRFPVISLLLVACLFGFHAWSQTMVRVQQLSTAIIPPSIITVSNGAQYVFTASTVRADGRVLFRSMQNTGTNAVIYAIGSVASTSSYHGVIAGGSAVRDGLGSVVDLSRYPGQISVITESGTSTIAIVELQQ